MENQLYSIKDAAKYLGVSAQTLRNWEKIGRIVPEYRLPSGHRRYTSEQLIRFRKGAK